MGMVWGCGALRGLQTQGPQEKLTLRFWRIHQEQIVDVLALLGGTVFKIFISH